MLFISKVKMNYFIFHVISLSSLYVNIVHGKRRPWNVNLPNNLNLRPRTRQNDHEKDSVNKNDLANQLQNDLNNALQQGSYSNRLSTEAGKACVPYDAWLDFEGTELHAPEVIAELARSGIEIAGDGPYCPKWKAASKKVQEILESLSSARDKFVEEIGEEVLVWTARFDDHCYGHELPIVKSRAIIPMSPKRFAELLMDSSKVRLYNKISLGRKDMKVFQAGIESEGTFGSGETKIVRNLTKPPLTKKTMEFVTLMHARRLYPEDGLGEGYVIVSRAVSGKLERESANESGENPAEQLRSEILLGVNIVRALNNDPNKADLTSITHVNSPMVPNMVAKKLGIKGAYDFVEDIRNSIK